ncbi:uncharacterized protein EV420DRAFT_1493156 [Desarmillaria tabescens]|uniref:F-box domain-containing protein n=1 Tax=Armillaria tabescens TaxID=1929756 RepID=A0AA39TSY3_ARMTA|nr:uncharacterized protein EV420DRAFT_1493156 [Desarmillaria tabescens]KAK0469227.1 hypothetical protein EV420DRAFT_1493156 [Desarmillaria tabescens]
MATVTLKRKRSLESDDALAQNCPSKRDRLSCESQSRWHSPPPPPCVTTLPDLPNELLLKILAELPDTVEIIFALATTCRRLNEFAMTYHFKRVSYELFDGTRRPFASFQMLRVSFIYTPSLSVIRCKFSNNFYKEMREVKRSLAPLKRMGLFPGKFSVSCENMHWPKLPTKQHVAFFHDLSKLKCKTMNTHSSPISAFVRPGGNITFDPPVLTKLLNVTLSKRPEQYIVWMLNSIKESPVKTLNLNSLSDDVLLKINEFSLSKLRNVTVLNCTFSFAAFSVFLERHPHIATLHLRTWNPISKIGGKREPRGSDHPKMSLEPATRMSLTCISGTATTLHALLSNPEVFPVLQSVTVTGEDASGTQEALVLISHIPSVGRLSVTLKRLNAAEWLRFKFPRWRGWDAKRAEPLLTKITDFSITFITVDVIEAVEVPAAVGLFPNLKRFRTLSSNYSEEAILGFVRRMKCVCPGLDTVTLNSSDFSTDLKWLRQKEMKLKEKKGK